MSKERLLELRELLFVLERKMRPLEWDSNRHQINEFKGMELQRLKEEHRLLAEELQQLEQQEQVAWSIFSIEIQKPEIL